MSPRKGGPRIERRRSIRADANLSMRVEGQPAEGDLTKIVTESQNISASGVYCTSPHYLAPLSKVALTIILPQRAAARRPVNGPSPRRLLKCDGIVVRCQAANGAPRHHGYQLACSFVGLDPRHRDVIEEFVSWRNLESIGRELERPAPRPSARRAARKPARAASRPRRAAPGRPPSARRARVQRVPAGPRGAEVHRGESRMAASLTLRPGPALHGRLRAPGDKSITHRAFLFGALARGMTEIENPNPGEDCAATLTCLRALGVAARETAAGVSIEGRAGTLVEPDTVLDCGNSGTTLRLLAGILAGQPFLSVLTGDDSLRRRPVDRVIAPLRRMGARLAARSGDRLPPLVIQGGVLQAIDFQLETDSAQVATAVLLAGTFAAGTTTVELGPARDHTERMLPGFGVPVTRQEVTGTGRARRSIQGPCTLRGTRLRVPGDFSAAAFFLAAAAATPGARVTAERVSLNPTRTGLLAVLEQMGAGVERETVAEEAGEPVGDVTVTGPPALRACDVSAELLPTMVDEVPAWAVAAAAAQGTSVLREAAELRLKESDRLAALAASLSRLGVAVTEARDGLAITGGRTRGGTVDALGDHRIAMALAVLATRAAEPVTIRGAGGIATSFPDFAATLAELGGRIEPPGAALAAT